MADQVTLSENSYETIDKAAFAGFDWIMREKNLRHEMNGKPIDPEQYEYAFFVVFKFDKQVRKMKYFYTNVYSQNSPEGVEARWPVGYNVSAFCHTHPKKYSTPQFSSGDKEQFKKIVTEHGAVRYYLLDPNSQVRLARSEADFMAGIWIQRPK